MKKINKKIFLLCILILVVSMIITIFISSNDKNKIVKNNDVKSKEVTRVLKDREFYTVKNILNKLWFNCKNINNPNKDFIDGKDELLFNVYKMLDKEYIDTYGLKENTLENKIKNICSDSFQINDMYSLQKKDGIWLYIVYAEDIYYAKDNENKITFLVKLDTNNNLFSIYLEDYIIEKGYNNLKLNDSIDIQLSSISNNEYNIYNNEIVYINKYQEDLFNDYQNSCSYNLKRAYTLLDDSCKNAKFNTYEKFEEYINKNIRDFYTCNSK